MERACERLERSSRRPVRILGTLAQAPVVKYRKTLEQMEDPRKVFEDLVKAEQEATLAAYNQEKERFIRDYRHHHGSMNPSDEIIQKHIDEYKVRQRLRDLPKPK
jgi:hypothetical protein